MKALLPDLHCCVCPNLTLTELAVCLHAWKSIEGTCSLLNPSTSSMAGNKPCTWHANIALPQKSTQCSSDKHLRRAHCTSRRDACTSVAMSAMQNCVACCAPMGRPNWWRCAAYSRAASRHCRAPPTLQAAMLTRPPSTARHDNRCMRLLLFFTGVRACYVSGR